VVGWQERGGGVVARRGEALSLAMVREESPSPLCALFRVYVWGVVGVRPGGVVRTRGAATTPPTRPNRPTGAFP